MTPETPSVPRISILARVLPAIPCLIVMLGAAANAILLMGVMNAMRNAESAGIGAVAGGMAEAHLSIVISGYLAIFVMAIGIIVIVIRSLTTAKTASPSAWYFAVITVLSAAPMALAWKANSLLVQALVNHIGIVEVASTIQLCLTLTLVTTVIFGLIILVSCFVPLPSFFRARKSWSPIIVLVLMEVALIVLAVVFQMNMAWLQRVGARESF